MANDVFTNIAIDTQKALADMIDNIVIELLQARSILRSSPDKDDED